MSLRVKVSVTVKVWEKVRVKITVDHTFYCCTICDWLLLSCRSSPLVLLRRCRRTVVGLVGLRVRVRVWVRVREKGSKG